eukprot:gnl/MRDRNA2_/MRDRNA2_123828_c0_seq1.p1 gnl/MRDRNA2_/MRDRNA2_123828_c0~~gnl/MRDRNA2_/MRDRNA2_123828_c0_seq1.p1  ORF type:complete len:133 (-),score=23.40 gnl/MRDRNA2_/MRDRNA2_123828_c0_seq1:27-425(-)
MATAETPAPAPTDAAGAASGAPPAKIEFGSDEWWRLAWQSIQEGVMDFEGQKICYDIQFYLIWVAGAIGFVIGYIVESFFITVVFIMVSTVAAGVITVPTWPMWKANQVEWLKPLPEVEKVVAPPAEEKKNQ